ncbi:MAG: hypothetical protein KGJ80_22485, partial [Chloroflexota bacterium]|nr:hypothetical protein [Chloroflexota bacterium]
DVMSRKRGLRLILNMPFNKVDDPQGICEDVTDVNHWGNGDVKVRFTAPDQIDYVMSLVRQAFEYQKTA